MLNQYAYFDSLFICRQLQIPLETVAKTEVHLFAYLSCLLSLYKGNPVANWEYSFAVTKKSYPYSPEIQTAIRVLINNEKFIEDNQYDNQYMQVTSRGEREYNFLHTLSQFEEREPFLAGACSSLLTIPVGRIHRAMIRGSGVEGTIELAQSKLLLNESGLDNLYKQFDVLSAALGVTVDDLMVPAVIWLTYLSETQRF